MALNFPADRTELTPPGTGPLQTGDTWNGYVYDASIPAWSVVPTVPTYNDITGKPSSFPPSTHATSHSAGGSDPIDPFDIGAATSYVSDTEPVNARTGSTWFNSATGKRYTRYDGFWVREGTDHPQWADINNKPSSFDPTHHKATHAIGGADALSPTDIGAVDASGGTWANGVLNGVSWTFGTGAASAFRTALGATTVGNALITLANPSAITFPSINADNSVSALNASAFRSALGATTVGDALITLANPSAITFPRINADNSVSALNASAFTTALGGGTAGVALFGAAAHTGAGSTRKLMGLDTTDTPTFANVVVGQGNYNTNAVRFIDGANGVGFYASSAGILAQVGSGTPAMMRINTGVVVGTSGAFCWSSTNDPSGTLELYITKDAANILAQRNGTTAQKFRVYGTTTGAKYTQLEHDGTNAILSTTAGILNMSQAVGLKSYTVATVPAASVGAGATIYVSDESGGAVLAYSDGTNWRRVTDRAIIS